MIRCAGKTKDGRPLLVLGLSGENVTRLMAAEPIHLELREMGLPDVAVIIFGGRTEQSMLDLLRERGVQIDSEQGVAHPKSENQ